jgi:hypothetical protein
MLLLLLLGLSSVLWEAGEAAVTAPFEVAEGVKTKRVWSVGGLGLDLELV